MRTIRIGSGAGFGGDRIEPALAVMEHGQIDYIIFECLAERTIALAQQHKATRPEKGYNIGALNFVMTHALGGGVTRSLALDRHGKSLSSALLEMEIEAD